MKFAGGAWAAACVAVFSARVANALPESTLSIDATTGEIEGDKSVVYYNSTPPQLVGNDGSAVSGGFRTWELTTPGERLKELSAEATGRTKLVTVVYSIQGVDYIITLSQSDQNLRWFNLQTGEELASARKYILGDFSSLCQWRSPDSGLQYVYLFGKKEVRMYLLDGRGSAPKTVEVREKMRRIPSSFLGAGQSDPCNRSNRFPSQSRPRLAPSPREIERYFSAARTEGSISSSGAMSRLLRQPGHACSSKKGSSVWPYITAR